MVGLNDTITLSFMIVGHTKFSPDSCFGLLKQQFRKTKVDTLQDLSNVVEKSASCNKVEMVGWEDGIPLIPTYDWSSYFAGKMLKVKGIKKYQHFTFTKSTIGKVSCSVSSDYTATEVSLLRVQQNGSTSWKPSSSTLPDIIQPKGLDAKRQWYLYEKIRPFCIEEKNKDKTCPLPSCPNPCNSTQGTPEPPSISLPPLTTSAISSPQSDKTDPPPAKRPRTCRNCGKTGHNARTCNQ